MASGPRRPDPQQAAPSMACGRGDLVALAAGALDEAEASAVRAAVSASPALMAELDAIRRHLRRYDALPPAPPPPPADSLLARLDGPRRGPAPRLAAAWQPRFAAAALLLLAVGFLAWQALDTAPSPNLGPVVAWQGTWRPPNEGGSRVATGTDVSQVRVSWPGRPPRHARLVASHGTAIRLGDAGHLQLEQGRLWVESPPSPSAVPLVVHTPAGEVRVVGTRFELDLDEAAALRVRVDRGVVEVRPVEGPAVRVEAGQVWSPAGLEAADTGLPAWHPRASIVLRAARWTADGALEVDAELHGDEGADVDLPLLGGGTSAPAWIEWIDADGEVDRSLPLLPAHVTSEEGLDTPSGGSPDLVARWLGGQPDRLPVGASRRFTLRFTGPLPSGSAYRLRALFRPSGAAPWLTRAIDVEAPR